MRNVVLKPYSEKVKAALVIILGSLSWIITLFKSGLNYSFGIGFWGANGHDAIWHIALIESLKKGTLSVPVFAGHNLQNYHIGFDLIMAVLSSITFIPVTTLYFQIIPILLAVLIGIFTYKLIFKWTGFHKSALWSTFFVYFGGSLGWVIGKGESNFWSQEAVSTLINPPFALSLLLIILGLLLLFKLIEKYSTPVFLSAVFIFGSLIEIKSYGGVLCLGALLVSGIYLFLTKRNFVFIKLFFASLILSLIMYLPLNKNPGGLFVFQPFWFLETMAGLTDRLNYQKLYSAISTYKSANIYYKLIPAYVFAFIIFWVGNMGTRIVKEIELFVWFKDVKKITWFEVFVSSVILAGVLVPMLFLQKGTPWNTIQFFYYSLFFSSILAGVAMQRIDSKLIATLIVFFTIPTTIISLKDIYLPIRPPAKISQQEISALSFLATQPQGVVLTRPFDEAKAREAEANPPRPLYLYTSTAYVSAFSKHQTYLEDEINLDITGIDWQSRRGNVLAWYNSKDYGQSKTFLRHNNISYIYWIKDGQSPLDTAKLSLENIYENNLITIYRVD